MNTSRRTFLRLSGLTAGSAILSGCAGTKTAGRRPLTIIDTHTHFYDPTRPQGVPWPEASDTFLYKKTMPTDYRAQKVEQPVTGTVVVEASHWVEDNQWILDIARNDPFIVGLCGNLPLGTPEFAGPLKTLVKNKLYAGMRHRQRSLSDDLKSPEFIRDVKLLADHNLELDSLGNTANLPHVNQLARRVPALRIVIDHLANTRIDGRNVDPEWRKNIFEVARNPNVHMKVSGLVEGTGRTNGTAPRDPEFYRPWLDIVWEAFGEDRLIYGSNWPVSARFSSLGTVQGIVYDYFSTKGSVALTKVFSGNAKNVYRWVNRD